MRADEVKEIMDNLKENMDFFIPYANEGERNYYLRGAIDALMSVKIEEDKTS